MWACLQSESTWKFTSVSQWMSQSVLTSSFLIRDAVKAVDHPSYGWGRFLEERGLLLSMCVCWCVRGGRPLPASHPGPPTRIVGWLSIGQSIDQFTSLRLTINSDPRVKEQTDRFECAICANLSQRSSTSGQLRASGSAALRRDSFEVGLSCNTCLSQCSEL